MKVNIISAIGGALMLLSIVAPWISFIFNLNLISLMGLSLSEGGPFECIMGLIIIFLMAIGGVLAIIRGYLGGVLGVIGIIIFHVWVLESGVELFSYLGIGYYLAWVGAILALISKKVKVERGT